MKYISILSLIILLSNCSIMKYEYSKEYSGPDLPINEDRYKIEQISATIIKVYSPSDENNLLINLYTEKDEFVATIYHGKGFTGEIELLSSYELGQNKKLYPTKVIIYGAIGKNVLKLNTQI